MATYSKRRQKAALKRNLRRLEKLQDLPPTGPAEDLGDAIRRALRKRQLEDTKRALEKVQENPMSFKITLEVDVLSSPNVVGEALRSSFFDEKMIRDGSPTMGYGQYKETGCYNTFDWQKDVEELPSLPLSIIHNHPDGTMDFDYSPACATKGMEWKRGQKNGIECRWYWDGDGTLAFKLPDGRWLANTDCKKSYGWELLAEAEFNDS